MAKAVPARIRRTHAVGIPCGREHRRVSGMPWRWIKELGVLSDREIARCSGIPLHRIQAMRRSLGIEPVLKTNVHRWTARMIADLKRLSLEAFIRKHPMSRRTAIAKRFQLQLPGRRPIREPIRWTPIMVSRLEKIVDAAVAQELRIGVATVREKRHAIKIGSAPRSAHRR